jgi:hypothetical protein
MLARPAKSWDPILYFVYESCNPIRGLLLMDGKKVLLLNEDATPCVVVLVISTGVDERHRGACVPVLGYACSAPT